MNKKKICLVIPSLKSGGMERVMSELANYFSTKNNVDIHLMMYGKKPSLFYNLSSNITVHFPESAFNDKFRTIHSIKRLVYLRKSIKKIKPDAVLSFGEYWNSFVLLALKGLKFPIFVSDRCKPDKSLGRVHDFLRKHLYKKASGIIAQTIKANEIYKKTVPPQKLKIIGNPIREINSDFNHVKEKHILMVSRLINTKHHDRLISIFSKLNAPGWKLMIIGSEDQKQKHFEHLQLLTQRLKIDERVFFEGEKQNVEDYYNRSLIFAFTSSSEGFPNVIGEALSAGLPVVSYDCVAGPSDMITDGENGFLVPVFDDEQFQQKLQMLIDDEDLRTNMAVNAKKSIKKFSVESIGQKYLDFVLS